MRLALLRDTYTTHGTLHHACLIEGSSEAIVEELVDFLEGTVSFSTKGNPDFYFGEYDSFGINDGKALQARAAQKPLGGLQIFIVTCNGMTREAQNALLKLFEEPTPNTHFFLVCKAADTLLGTLRSRMFVVGGEGGVAKGVEKEAQTFLHASPKERLAFIKEITDTKDKGRAITFLHALEIELKKRKKTTKEEFQALLDAEIFIRDKGSSMKLLLEHLALTLA